MPMGAKAKQRGLPGERQSGLDAAPLPKEA